jgi:hypothetical protein
MPPPTSLRMETADLDRRIQARNGNAENGGGKKHAKLNNSSTDEYFLAKLLPMVPIPFPSILQ